jgi:O-antigen/teichoic acid export membrane protein
LVIPESRIITAFWIYQISVMAAFVSLIQVPFIAVIISHEKMKIFSYAGITDSILKLLIAIILNYVPFDKLLFYAVAMGSVTIIIAFSYFIYVRISIKYCKFSFQKNKILYKQTLSYSSYDLLGNFSVVAQGQGLNMLLNIFFGATVNAARGIAYQAQGALAQFGNNFMLAVRPQIIKYYAEKKNSEMINLVFKSSKYSFFLLWILSLPVLIETKYILTMWLKIVPDNTVVFTRLVLITSLISAIRNPFISAMHATGKIKISNVICGTMLIATLPISYLFLKIGFQAEVVFVISLIITFLSMWVEWILIRYAVYFSIYKAVTKVLCIAVIVAVLSFVLPFLLYYYLDSSLIRFGIISITSMMSVAISIYYIGIDGNERLIIINKIKSMRKRCLDLSITN